MGNTCCSSSSPSSGNENVVVLRDLNLIEDVTHLDDLINYIQQRLNAIDKAKESASEAGSSGREAVRSVRANLCIQFGSSLLENVRKRVNTRTCKICFKYALSRETRKVVGHVLKESAKVHWVAIGLSVVAYALDQIDQISVNRVECLQLLRYMFGLAKHIKQLDGQLPQAEKELNDVVQFIVKGCIMCLSQMTSSNLSSFFSASMNAEDLKSFKSELAHTYSDLTLESIIALLEDRPTSLPPSQGQYPDAVGIDKARVKVSELLDMKDSSPRAVVVYGVGGIGKTTLATAVFNKLNLTGYKHCRLNVLQNCSDNDLKLLQQQILKDLFERKLELRDCVEGQDELSNSFEKKIAQPIFMFIDNALRGTDLVKLLPRNLSCLPPQSRLLITTRKFDETDMPLHPHMQRHAHRVDSLPSSEAKKLLCKKALGSAQANFENDVDVDGLVEICGGIPLVLEMVGGRLKKDGKNVSAWHTHLRETLAEGEGDISEKVVDCVYNTLPDLSYKEAFLDIASFSSLRNRLKRRWLGYIVGKVQLKALEDAALITISDDGRLEMHDIVEARGKWLSQSDRITDKQGLKDILQDKQRLHQIKGIVFNEAAEAAKTVAEEAAEAEAKAAAVKTKAAAAATATAEAVKDEEEWAAVALAAAAAAAMAEEKAVAVAEAAADKAMESFDIDVDDIKSLRILHLSKSLKFKGRSSKTFKNLRYIFSAQNPPFVLKNLKRLAVLIIDYKSTVCELPRSLRLLLARSLNIDESIGNLSSLEELGCGTRCISLPNTFCQLHALHRLIFFRCKKLTELPESFGSLGALEKLNLEDVPKLKRLPDSFGQLNSLSVLKLQHCYGLTALPESFGNLSSLESLKLNACRTLQSLPRSFSQLSNLKVLQMIDCRELSSLPDKFGQLKSLKYLSIESCDGLKSLCNDFGCLKSLVAMKAVGCSQLEGEVMDSLVEVKSTMFLNITGSPMLIERWAHIKETHPLLLYSDMAMSFDDRPHHEFVEKMLSAVTSGERKCIHVDGGGKIVKWMNSFPSDSPLKVALFFTLRNLFSPSNGEALQTVRETILELTAQHFHVIYIAGLEEEEESEELHQKLLSLPEGVLSWMPPHRRMSKLFAYSAFSVAESEHIDVVPDAFHSFIVSLSMSMDGEGKPQMQNPKLSLCVGNYSHDFGGNFEWLFHTFKRGVQEMRSFGRPSSKDVIKLLDDVEG